MSGFYIIHFIVFQCSPSHSYFFLEAVLYSHYAVCILLWYILDQCNLPFGVQGIPLKIPMIDKKYLDLYTLHKVGIVVLLYCLQLFML